MKESEYKSPLATVCAKTRCAMFVAIRGFALAKSRLRIMKGLLDNGWQVIAVGNADEHVHTLTDAGIVFEPIDIEAGSLSPIKAMGSYRRLVSLYSRYKPDVVHHFQAKPVILGCAAARQIGGAKVFNTITGLGHAFVAGGPKRWLASASYRVALRRATKTVFQNPDDRALFLNQGLLQPEDSELIVGSGVNIEEFQPSKLCGTAPTRVLLVGRLLWEKGLREFIEAAYICSKKAPGTRFQIAGELAEDHPSGVPRHELDRWVDNGVIEYLGYVRDMPRLLAQASIVVLPSYREGVPRVLLEAAACARPVITTDSAGCKETVVDGTTGLLVPVRDSGALAEAVLKLTRDIDLSRQLGLAGRNRAEQLFDERSIASQYLDLYRREGLEIGTTEWEAKQDVKVA